MNMVAVDSFSKVFREAERDKVLYFLRSVPPYVGRVNPKEDNIFGIQRRYRELSGNNVPREEMTDYLTKLLGIGFIVEKERSSELFYTLTREGHDFVEATTETVEL